MELNIISVAFITAFIIIYVVSLITYLLMLLYYFFNRFSLDWRIDNGKLNILEKAKAVLLGLAGCIPFVNTCILLYYFFNRSSR